MSKQKIATIIPTIEEIVRKMEQNFITGNNQVSKYVIESPYEDISTIEAYLNSKHISGDKDALEREKPFANICVSARNIYFRATDLDRKNIKFKANNSKEIIPAFIANILLQKWMQKDNFGQFLNAWGLDLAGYNSSVVKFIEQGNELHRIVVPWNRIICDFIDFASNPKIEILELTQAQLRQKEGYDQDMVDKLMDNIVARQDNARQTKDNKNEYIRLYEVHGNLSLYYLTGKEKDKSTYVQQMHVITFTDGDDFSLYSGKEEKDPYMLTSLIPATDGSISLMGSVKSLFDSQWMQNHVAKLTKDELDFTSNKIYHTNDPNFVSKNSIKNFTLGDIITSIPNTNLTPVNMQADTFALQNYSTQWKALGNEMVGISESMLGKNPPSGMAWRQTEAVLQENYSLFEIMTENKGLSLEDMLREYVIPHLKKVALGNTKEISSILEDNDIKRIDSKYIKNESIKMTNRQIIDKVLKGETVLPEEQEMMMQENSQEVKSKLDELGNQRFFKPSEITTTQWREIFKDFEWDIECEITGENKDKQATLTTLTTVLQTIASNPAILENPNAKLLFNKIIMETGIISPIEISETPALAPQQGGNQVGASMKELPAELAKQQYGK